MNNTIEVQMDQNRLNLIEQELLRVERELSEQQMREKDCEAEEARLEGKLYDVHSAMSFSQKMEQLVQCRERHKEALERHLRLNEQLRQFRDEKFQIVSRLRAYAMSVPSQSAQRPEIVNLYSETEKETMIHDVFISHATEDKESFVNELVEELKKRNVKVWVDDLKIKWGDPLRKSIDEGLKKSRFGIVVISKHFIAKGWTQYELDGLFEKEMSGGKVILPIWHEITKKEVQAFSPTLAGRKAMTTATMTPADIADELVSLLAEEKGKVCE